MAAAKKKAGTAVATTKKSDNAPDFVKRGGARGTETIKQADVIVPRVDLLQALSETVVSGEMPAGNFFHNVVEEDLGDEINFIPILCGTKYILWNPRHMGGGILARAEDGVHWKPANGEWKVRPYKETKKEVLWSTAATVEQSGLDEWGSSDPDDPDSPPAASKVHFVLAHLIDFPDISPAIISMQRGTLASGKKFISRLSFDSYDIFAKTYCMTSTGTQNKDGDDYLTFKFTGTGFVEDEDLYRHCEGLYKRFSESEWAVSKEDELQGDGERQTGSGKEYDV